MNGVNSVLGLADLKLVRDREQDFHDPTTFIPLRETITAAERAGMPLGEYIESAFNAPGSIEATISGMRELGVFDAPRENICEIGPGSGRFLDPVREICGPGHYEIYETAAPWARWLVNKYGVTLRPTDGRSLAATPDASIDLVHAHKVFVAVPFLAICRYLTEMMRVVGTGGCVVFDVFTDESLSAADLRTWTATDIDAGAYPSLITKKVVADLFGDHDFELLGTFHVPMKPGQTQYFVFRRR